MQLIALLLARSFATAQIRREIAEPYSSTYALPIHTSHNHRVHFAAVDEAIGRELCPAVARRKGEPRQAADREGNGLDHARY